MSGEGRPEIRRDIGIETVHEKIVDRIKHEDELTNNRLNWFIASQGFGGTMVAIINYTSNDFKYFSLALLSFVMLLISISALIGAISAARAIKGLCFWWQEYLNENDVRDNVLPPIMPVTYEISSETDQESKVTKGENMRADVSRKNLTFGWSNFLTWLDNRWPKTMLDARWTYYGLPILFAFIWISLGIWFIYHIFQSLGSASV